MDGLVDDIQAIDSYYFILTFVVVFPNFDTIYLLEPSLVFFRDFLLEGLTVLKNRGYDSAGLATMPSNGGSMV